MEENVFDGKSLGELLGIDGHAFVQHNAELARAIYRETRALNLPRAPFDRNDRTPNSYFKPLTLNAYAKRCSDLQSRGTSQRKELDALLRGETLRPARKLRKANGPAFNAIARDCIEAAANTRNSAFVFDADGTLRAAQATLDGALAYMLPGRVIVWVSQT